MATCEYIDSIKTSDGTSHAIKDTTSGYQTAADVAAAIASKVDLIDGKIPSNQLPAYVDDVLNSMDYAKKLYEIDKIARSCYYFPFDPRCLSNLKYLVDITNSSLVITSTWRMHEIGKEILISELRK